MSEPKNLTDPDLDRLLDVLRGKGKPPRRARARIGLKNLAYNMRRLVQLERLAAAAAPT